MCVSCALLSHSIMVFFFIVRCLTIPLSRHFMNGFDFYSPSLSDLTRFIFRQSEFQSFFSKLETYLKSHVYDALYILKLYASSHPRMIKPIWTSQWNCLGWSPSVRVCMIHNCLSLLNYDAKLYYGMLFDDAILTKLKFFSFCFIQEALLYKVCKAHSS